MKAKQIFCTTLISFDFSKLSDFGTGITKSTDPAGTIKLDELNELPLSYQADLPLTEGGQ